MLCGICCVILDSDLINKFNLTHAEWQQVSVTPAEKIYNHEI